MECEKKERFENEKKKKKNEMKQADRISKTTRGE